ncbi:hypothetical protein [Nonomuraea jiangxiensis]|uniref:Uncharacterized protein n=1 Tax=Nonomuraea jiangxiensis TaxID=633440 RepID=A0A1G9IDK0_9ACTN|nr:hypothetical protein [Nonomuraea jiangxiensis]SDL23115.1 hypothetical protein SAMN05421869_123152 [Nonomuraea jiangxiensis]
MLSAPLGPHTPLALLVPSSLKKIEPGVRQEITIAIFSPAGRDRRLTFVADYR